MDGYCYGIIYDSCMDVTCLVYGGLVMEISMNDYEKVYMTVKEFRQILTEREQLAHIKFLYENDPAEVFKYLEKIRSEKDGI